MCFSESENENNKFVWPCVTIHDTLANTILQGRVEGIRNIGRPNMSGPVYLPYPYLL